EIVTICRLTNCSCKTPRHIPPGTRPHDAWTRPGLTKTRAVPPDARSLRYHSGHSTGIAGTISLNRKLRHDVVFDCFVAHDGSEGLSPDGRLPDRISIGSWPGRS